MPTKNVDLMLRVREQITTHPETHNQNQWARRGSCGTTHCIGGWAVAFSRSSDMEWYSLGDLNSDLEACITVAGQYIPDAARDALGLTEKEAERLFYDCSNTEALQILDEYIEQGKNGG